MIPSETERGTAHQPRPPREDRVQWGWVLALSILCGLLPALWVVTR